MINTFVMLGDDAGDNSENISKIWYMRILHLKYNYSLKRTKSANSISRLHRPFSKL